MYLHNTMKERNCDGEGCDTCPYQAITVDIFACELERGSSYVHLAARLWSLVDPDRAKKIGSWLEDEWFEHRWYGELDENGVRQDPNPEDYDEDDDDWPQCYNPASSQYLLNLIEGLPEALQKKYNTTRTLRITAQQAKEIRAQHPFLVDNWTGESGEVFTLTNHVGEVKLLCALLRTAIKHNRDICVG